MLATERRWKTPVLPFIANLALERPGADDLALLAQADVTCVSDLVGRMYTCQASLRSLVAPSIAICGPAFTVKCPPGDNLGVMAALRAVAAGDVLVIDGQGFTYWCMGGFEMLQYAFTERGVAGVVVNGAWRDIADVQKAGFPLYGLAVSPYSGLKLGPAELNVPVACAGVIVQPGDVVCASVEGVAIVPRASVPRVTAALRQPAGGQGIEPFLQAMDTHVADWMRGSTP